MTSVSFLCIHYQNVGIHMTTACSGKNRLIFLLVLLIRALELEMKKIKRMNKKEFYEDSHYFC